MKHPLDRVMNLVVCLFIGIIIGFAIGVAGNSYYADDDIAEARAERDAALDVDTLRCPEDADFVIRWGVDPAGTFGYCVATDNIEVLR